MQKIALLVDDSRVARMTLKKLLVAHEFEVVELGSGEEALAHLQSTATLPNIIFMDVMMDGMDGLTATRQIKAESHLSAIPVVICTGNDAEADIENALATGAIAVLSKPPAADALVNVLAKVEQQSAPLELADAEPEAVVTTHIEQPATPNVDESQLVEKIVSQLEQSLLATMKQEMRETAEDISRQVAADTAEQLIQAEVKSSLDSLMPAQIEALMAQVKQQSETTAQQIAKQAAKDAVSHSAEQVVQRHVAQLDLSALAVQVLSSEGTLWLKHQQQQLLTQLSQELQHKIQAAIDDKLEQSLEQRIAPLVIVQVNQMLAQQAAKTDPNAESKVLEQTAAIARLNKLVVGLGIGLVAVAALAGVALL